MISCPFLAGLGGHGAAEQQQHIPWGWRWGWGQRWGRGCSAQGQAMPRALLLGLCAMGAEQRAHLLSGKEEHRSLRSSLNYFHLFFCLWSQATFGDYCSRSKREITHLAPLPCGGVWSDQTQTSSFSRCCLHCSSGIHFPPVPVMMISSTRAIWEGGPGSLSLAGQGPGTGTRDRDLGQGPGTGTRWCCYPPLPCSGTQPDIQPHRTIYKGVTCSARSESIMPEMPPFQKNKSRADHDCTSQLQF